MVKYLCKYQSWCTGVFLGHSRGRMYHDEDERRVDSRGSSAETFRTRLISRDCPHEAHQPRLSTRGSSKSRYTYLCCVQGTLQYSKTGVYVTFRGASANLCDITRKELVLTFSTTKSGIELQPVSVSEQLLMLIKTKSNSSTTHQPSQHQNAPIVGSSPSVVAYTTAAAAGACVIREFAAVFSGLLCADFLLKSLLSSSSPRSLVHPPCPPSRLVAFFLVPHGLGSRSGWSVLRP
eukprot:scaffold13215_cov61-Cyclotella_meneghiniana.AAC.3